MGERKSKKIRKKGTEGEKQLSILREKLAARKNSIENKTKEIRDLISVSSIEGQNNIQNNNLIKPEFQHQSEKEEGELSLTSDNKLYDPVIKSPEDPIQENIIARQKNKTRITLKERIQNHTKEIKENHASTIPEGKYSNPEKISRIREYLLTRQVTIDSYREKYFQRTLNKRLIRLRLSSYNDYFNYLKDNSQELKKFQDSLSINFTRFFRDRDTWEFIQSNVFKPLINRANSEVDKNKIRIWSAGCAVGAEPYSIKILWSKLKKGTAKSTSLEILATDINEEIIMEAKKASFVNDHLSELTNAEIHKFFKQQKETFALKDNLKQDVKFVQLDLVNDPSPGMFDIIICRNVLIYLDNDAKEIIFNKFFKSLSNNGYLILGKSESIAGSWKKQWNSYSIEHRIYQKR